MNKWTYLGRIDGYDGFDETGLSFSWYISNDTDESYINVSPNGVSVAERIESCFDHQDDFSGISWIFEGHFGGAGEHDLILDYITEVIND